MARRLRDAYTRYPRPLLWLVEGNAAIDSFYIAKLPVTNVQFEAFDPGFERQPSAPADDDPAVGVDLASARGYAAWYADVSRKAMRLPTVKEWRWATAGVTGWPNASLDSAALDDHAWHQGNIESSRSVPRLDAKRHNPQGLYATLGGVWEWCEAEGNDARLCGGSFRSTLEQLETLPVVSASAVTTHDDVGFRIAKSMR